MDGPQSRSGRRGEEKILEPTGTRIPIIRSWTPQPVWTTYRKVFDPIGTRTPARSQSLYRLHYPGSLWIPQKVGNSLSNLATVSFSEIVLLRGVNA
jgi:hypothetical protein